MGDPKMGSIFVHVTVTGHASMRWKGSRDLMDASRRNDALSAQRAKNIGEVVKQQLKRHLPERDIEVRTKSVGAFGSPDLQRPNDNEPFTRIVHVVMHVTSRVFNNRAQLHPNRRVNARTSLWYLRVSDLFTLAGGVAGANVDLHLRNAVSQKEMNYMATIWGGGIGVSSSKGKAPSVIKNQLTRAAKPVVGEEVFFMTDRDMGFADFDGKFIRIGMIDASLFVGASFHYLSFEALGENAELLVFQHKIGAGKLSLASAMMSGPLEMVGYHPGDYFEVPVDDTVVRTQNDLEHNEGIVLVFPTGKAGFNDLSAVDRNRLMEFLSQKAKNVRLLMEHYDGPFQPQT